MLIRSTRWRQKPAAPFGVEIDGGHPLARGLEAYLIPMGGARVLDLAHADRGKGITYAGSAVFRHVRGSYGSDHASSSVDSYRRQLRSNPAVRSYLWHGIVDNVSTAPSGQSHFTGLSTDASEPGGWVGPRVTGGSLEASDFNGATVAVALGTIPSGAELSIAQSSGTDLKGAAFSPQSGFAFGTTAGTSWYTGWGANPYINIGMNPNGIRTPDYCTFVGAIWTRALSADELALLVREPYVVLRPRISRTYVFAVAGGGGGGSAFPALSVAV